ncbi:MAG: Cadherin domain-containing protein [Ignavibacteria bacterium]|nr:MAG: Cadherin domain-containing protein [Ignavibacteria bacterium]KAF0160949.1 MAG: Cadherin domain-containing protein [Ignavibacteria bacterium]
MVLGQTVSIPIKVSNNMGDTQLLKIGIDPSATDGVDGSLGEAVLPPLPPKDIFDARLKLPTSSNDFSTADFRFGTKPPFASTITYFLEFQPGMGTSITIEWDLPKETSGVIKDKFGGIIINRAVNGIGSFTVTNLALNKLDLIVQYNLISSINHQKEIPNAVELYQNYPNPFNPSTTISYSIPVVEALSAAEVHVSLKVYDVLGREIATLVNEYKQAGTYNENFNVKTRRGASLQSGTYFYRLQAGGPSAGSRKGFVQTKKMVVAK